MNADAIKSSLAEVPLDDIKISETNKMFRDEKDFTQESLQELINSIMENGLAQPILLRPNGTGGKFVLVAGERRFRASKFIMGLHKDRRTIPAYIRQLTEDQAFDLQLTENIERKDIHPMREARAYKFLHDTKKWTTSEIALRFAKTEEYVLKRQKLNTLIDEAEKDFTNNYMTLGHAILIARLTPEDQKEVLKHNSNKDGTKKYYESIHEMEEFIQDNIVRDLKEATFDINDPQLVPKAGSCLTCPKRSGYATQLFADVKEKDRCFDGGCFQIKRSIALIARVKELVEKQPDTIFLEAYAYQKEDKIAQPVASFLSSQKIKPLGHNSHKSHSSSWDNFNKKITGFMLNGDKAGRMVQVWVKGAGKTESKSASTSGPEKLSATDIKEAVQRIKERTTRAAELDQEKIYTKTVELLQGDMNMSEREPGRTAPCERALVALMLYNQADYKVREELDAFFKFKSKPADCVESFKSLTDRDLLIMAIRISTKQYSSPFNHDKEEGLLLTEIARMWGIPVDDLVKAQADERKTREARAKQRIVALNAQLKPKKVKA